MSQRPWVEFLASSSDTAETLPKPSKPSREDDDRHAFAAIQMEEAATRLLRVLRVVLPLKCLLGFLFVLYYELKTKTIYAGLFNSFCWGVACFQEDKLRTWIKIRPIAFGSLVQVVFHFTWVFILVVVALQIPNTLLKHRFFLILYQAALAYNAAFCYTPFRVFAFAICPIDLAGWLVFHNAVDFLPWPCILCVLLLIGCTLYVQHLQTAFHFKAFQTNQDLVKERRRLQATHESVLGILSSIFDASCMCDQHGRLLDCSPHLRQILDCSRSAQRLSGRDSEEVNLKLPSFAANPAECKRLEDFIQNAVSSARHQAAKIQCSFRSAYSTDGVIEASLHAIAMPGMSCGECDRLYIALQTESLSPDTGKAPPEGSVELSLNFEKTRSGALNSGDRCRQRRSKAMTETDLTELSSEWDRMSIPPIMGSNKSSQEKSSLAYTASEMGSFLEKSSASGAECPNTVATQTHAESVDAEVQTLEARSTALPPRLPNRVRSQNSHPPVSLSTSRLIRPGWQETPKSTVNQVIYEMMHQLNLRGKGCCLWHISLYNLQKHMLGMMAQACNKEWMPYQDWQCAHCLSLRNMEDVDEESSKYCTLCWADSFDANVTADPRERNDGASSCAGDDEWQAAPRESDGEST